MKLVFKDMAEDLTVECDAFNSALDSGMMARDTASNIFWARFEYLASDVENGTVVADWFYSRISNVWTRVERKDGAE